MTTEPVNHRVRGMNRARDCFRLFGAAAALVLLGFGNATAQPGQAGDVSVRAAATPSEGPFHRLFTYTITVEAPEALDVTFPDLAEHAGDLKVYRDLGREEEPLDDGRVRITTTFALDAPEAGEYAIEPPPVTYGPDAVEANVPPVAIQARELTPDEQQAVMRFAPDAGPAAPATPWWRQWQVWALVTGAAAVAVFAAWLWARRRAAQAGREPLTAWDGALKQLDELSAQNLPASGDFNRYYVELSRILRDYLAQRFAIHAQEQTTQELLEDASANGALTEQQQQFLAGFLRHSDRVKFARFQPSAAEARRHLDDIRAFVTETIRREEPRQEAA
ncbi:MAG: hypothetical protein ACLFU6_00270 [Candidatus Hydrogenedentota bacterium]